MVESIQEPELTRGELLLGLVCSFALSVNLILIFSTPVTTAHKSRHLLCVSANIGWRAGGTRSEGEATKPRAY